MPDMTTMTPNRTHPAVVGIRQFFDARHLSPPLDRISRACAELADKMIEGTHGGPELTTGLRKLLEAKDCFVRAALPPKLLAGAPIAEGERVEVAPIVEGAYPTVRPAGLRGRLDADPSA